MRRNHPDLVGRLRAALAVLAVLLFAGCAVEPRPIHIGSEECAHCRMVISEPRFAAQALTTRGMAYKFDSIECMADFLAGPEAPEAERLHSTWVADFSEPGRWIPADDAYFLYAEALRTPMGMGLAAFAAEKEAGEHAAVLEGRTLRWSDVRALVAAEGFHEGRTHAH